MNGASGWKHASSMADMSRSEEITAIVVAIGMYFLFDHFRLIPSSYLAGRLVAKAAVLLGGGIVILVWPFIVRKKKDDSDDES
jgi:hypothetical protein